MSDIPEGNEVHQTPEDYIETMYVKSAERLMHPSVSPADRMRFMSFHSAENVIKLGATIKRLREENSALMEQLYGETDT